jgi:hypothetical protein
MHVSFRLLGLVAAVFLAIASGEIAAAIWHLLPTYVEAGEGLLILPTVLVIVLRRRWNPFGQLFFGAFLAAAVTYLAFAVDITFASGLSPAGMVASAALLQLELFALALSASFTFEDLDVLTRTRWDRPIPDPDPSYRPMVSLRSPRTTSRPTC